MSQDDLNAQLNKMHRQLSRLRDERAEAKPHIAPAATAAAEQPTAETPDDWPEELAEFNPEDLLEEIRSRFGNWAHSLDEELRDIKPSTLLTIFGAGFIVGRLSK